MSSPILAQILQRHQRECPRLRHESSALGADILGGIGRVSNLFEIESAMWNWFNCYLSGRHEYGIWCEPGSIFLRCLHCGRRSPGWALDTKAHHHHDHERSEGLLKGSGAT